MEDVQMNGQYNEGVYSYNQNENNVDSYQSKEYPLVLGYLLLLFVMIVFMSYLCELCGICPQVETGTPEKKQLSLKLTEQLVTDSLLCEPCVICLDQFEKKDKITNLKCNHVFHHVCIVEWTLKNKSCPLCRIELL